MRFAFPELVVAAVYSLLYVVPVVYLLVVVTRVMKAVERIARKVESSDLGS